MFPSDTHFDTKVTLETESLPVDDDAPFHILLLGDWSGRESRKVNSDLAKSKPLEIDKDNFEEVMQRINVGLNLDFQNNGENILSLKFTEFEDFHPDKIFQQIPLFAALRDVRRRLMNSQTFNDAAREVRSWLADTESEKAPETKSQNPATENIESLPGDLLGQILGDAVDKNTVSNSQTIEDSGLSSLVRKLVKPYLIQTDTAEQSELLMIVDEVISDLMRKILHHPQFQALESAWRGAHFLVKRVETDSELKIYILDVGKDELADNLKNINSLTESHLHQVLSQQVGESFDKGSWAAIFGNYTFALNVEDAAVLVRLSRIVADSNVSFISHIKPSIFGLESFAEIDPSVSFKISEGSTEEKLWTMLRSAPETTHLALALPQTLARLPYGADTDPTEAFYFEEFTSSIRHEHYLWTNPIFVAALLLAQTFRKFGWNISRNFLQQVEGFPVHSYKDGVENKTKPCAEILMTHTNCEKLLEQGLIPLISFKDSDKIRLGNFQSIAFPPTVLKGKWH